MPVFDEANFRQDFQTLTLQLQHDGLLTPSRVSGLLQTLAVSLCWLLSLTALALRQPWFSVVPMAMAYIFNGWMAHDVAHFQVVKNRSPLYRPLCWFIVATSGLSMRWWQVRHTRHHAHTNEYMRDDKGHVEFLDEDLQGLPFVCWDASSATPEQRRHPLIRAWIRLQPYALWPLLSTVHFTMTTSSFQVGRLWERLTMIAHHGLLVAGFAWASSSLAAGVGLWLLAHALTGLYFGILFIWSHTGRECREVNSKRACAGRRIVDSTRNVRMPAWFETTLGGGMGYQIEHHLFPTMPRHRFAKASIPVRAFLARHGVEYCSESVGQALASIQDTLHREAASFLNTYDTTTEPDTTPECTNQPSTSNA